VIELALHEAIKDDDDVLEVVNSPQKFDALVDDFIDYVEENLLNETGQRGELFGWAETFRDRRFSDGS